MTNDVSVKCSSHSRTSVGPAGQPDNSGYVGATDDVARRGDALEQWYVELPVDTEAVREDDHRVRATGLVGRVLRVQARVGHLPDRVEDRRRDGPHVGAGEPVERRDAARPVVQLDLVDADAVLRARVDPFDRLGRGRRGRQARGEPETEGGEQRQGDNEASHVPHCRRFRPGSGAGLRVSWVSLG